MSDKPPTTNQPCTIEHAIKAMQHWRENKASYPKRGIPDDIWAMVFKLEKQGYSVSHLRQIFGLNSEQYKKKRTQFHSKTKTDNHTSVNQSQQESDKDVTPQFSEAIIVDEPIAIPSLSQSAEQTKNAIKKIKSNSQKSESYLAMNTVIVEYIRPDGHSLKIHTTHSHLESLMQTFYNQGTISA